MCYSIGFINGLKAAFALREHNENNGETPISKAIIFSVVAGVLIALPEFLRGDSNRGCF